MTLSNRLYDILKPVTALILPAVATLYLALGQIWDFPNPDSVAQSITAINVFLGVLLLVTSKNYGGSTSDDVDSPVVGQIDTTVNEDGKTVYTLAVNGDPQQVFANQDQVTFVVNKA